MGDRLELINYQDDSRKQNAGSVDGGKGRQVLASWEEVFSALSCSEMEASPTGTVKQGVGDARLGFSTRGAALCLRLLPGSDYPFKTSLQLECNLLEVIKEAGVRAGVLVVMGSTLLSFYLFIFSVGLGRQEGGR